MTVWLSLLPVSRKLPTAVSGPLSVVHQPQLLFLNPPKAPPLADYHLHRAQLSCYLPGELLDPRISWIPLLQLSLHRVSFHKEDRYRAYN